MRPVTWLQWGIKADTGQPREWSDAGTHRGGREAWRPPGQALEMTGRSTRKVEGGDASIKGSRVEP